LVIEERKMMHTTAVRDFNGTSAQLAEAMGDLYYDSLAELLTLLAQKMAADNEADLQRGRPKLAAELNACAEHIQAAAHHIQSAWTICAPYTSKPRQANPV
jgi:hypothetical protein